MQKNVDNANNTVKAKSGKHASAAKKEKSVREEVKEQPIFSKVVTKQENNKKEIKEEPIFTKFIKILLIIVIILIIAYILFFIRNNMIFNDIAEKMQLLQEVNNYSYQSNTKVNNSNDITTVKYSKNNNVTSVTFSRNNEELITLWKDDDNKEKITLYSQTKKAEISDSIDEVIVMLPLMNELESGTVRALLSLGTLVYSEQYNDRDCYIIKLDKNQKVWIDKETGLVLKREYANNYTEYTNIKLNNNEKITRPDLTGYTLVK